MLWKCGFLRGEPMNWQAFPPHFCSSLAVATIRKFPVQQGVGKVRVTIEDAADLCCRPRLKSWAGARKQQKITKGNSPIFLVIFSFHRALLKSEEQKDRRDPWPYPNSSDRVVSSTPQRAA